MSRISGALLAVLLTTGCQAYSKAAFAVLDNANVVAGSARVTNTMSVGICGYAMAPQGAVPDAEAKLVKKRILPGATETVSIPYLGKPSEDKPQPEAWTARFYGCKEGAYDFEPGMLLTTLPVTKDAEIAVR